MGAERDRVAGFGRMEDGLRQSGDWYRWGPYVSERQWGTVREDYSADGEAWDYLPHDHARSRAYRWGEDGLAGFCDVEQRLCLGLALWNGRDPILKERAFGLTGAQGNHGEDVKEYWWYLDAIPSHAWNRWRYHYPQAAFPYEDLIDENGSRNQFQPEYELIDTGVFDEDRYWIVEVHYAKAGPDDMLMTIEVTNAGPDADDAARAADGLVPQHLVLGGRRAPADHVGDRRCRGRNRAPVPRAARADRRARARTAACPTRCSARTRPTWPGCSGRPPVTPYPKDGINDHVICGAATVNPERTGTKCAFWYKVTLGAGATAELRLRLRPRPTARPARRPTRSAPSSTSVMASTAGRGRRVLRRADAGHGDRRRGDGDAAGVRRDAVVQAAVLLRRVPLAGRRPGPAAPPPERLTGRNSRWRNFDAFDIMSMPDKWEYPWFAAWDLAFHCVALAHVDPAFAKYQLILLCREWFQHPNGALPAYEWDFGDVNPPVQAWAALEVFAIDGGRDIDFLSRVFDKLLVNFTWWVNREDAEGNNLFEGGFLGLDNIGPIDRSHLPVGGILEQSDATGWMGFYAIAMGAMAIVLNRSGQRPGQDLVLKFLEHFAAITRGAGRARAVGRDRRALLRPAHDAERGDRAGEGPVDGRHHPRPGRRGHRRG